jgi:hypothetical protein
MVVINLLPDERKKEIRAGRANVLLLRYIVITLTAVVLLGGLLVGSYVVLDGAKQGAQLKVSENQARVSAYNDVRSQADSFRADLATAKSVLDNDISYTKLIYKIANKVPHNVVLNDLTLDPASFGTALTMNASAKTFDDAGKLRDSFINSGEIFTNVQLKSLSSGDDSSSGSYPVNVTLSVVINKGALR